MTSSTGMSTETDPLPTVQDHLVGRELAIRLVLLVIAVATALSLLVTSVTFRLNS